MEIKKTDLLIIGGGVSGLALDHFVKKLQPNRQSLIVEKTQRLGGAIESFKKEGYQGEWGAHGFLNNCAESQELLGDLDLLSKVQEAPLKEFSRFICKGGKLECLPQNPKKILSTKLLSWPAKLRVLGDLFTKPKRQDQTVSSWAELRFGPSIIPFIDAAITGTYAGDIERLSIGGVMPGLREKELAFGSVLKAVIKGNKVKGEGAETAPVKKGLPRMQSFSGGMEDLIKGLAQNREVLLGQEAQKIKQAPFGWQVQTGDYLLEAKQLVLALPLQEAWKLLNPLVPAPLPPPALAKIYNVLLGFGPEVEIPYGFGYLAPRVEKRFLLGALFSSKMFPDRTPEGGGLLECLVGGRLYPERLERSDEELISSAMEDLSQLLPLPKQPLFAQVLRPTAAIPQPEMGHDQFLNWREKLQSPSLQIIGFGWEGIGINEMNKMAKEAASNLCSAEVEGAKQEKEIKGVYF
ncbi:MAG: protoporphyrinogen oxidase [SAR324 cluster bacterium]|nr:protoporphyrinogen oxidase [SAR324 cluster bacterium]